MYKSYWPIFIIAIILSPILLPGIIDFRVVYKSSSFIKAIFKAFINFLGLSHLLFGDFKYTLNQTWWHLSLAIVLIMVIPFLVYAIQKRPILVISISLILVILFPKIKYIQYLISVIIGIIFAKYNLFELIHQKNKPINITAKILLLIISFFLWRFAHQNIYINTYSTAYDGLFATIIISSLFDFAFPVTFIRKPFSFLGKYSADIFYIHSFVYCYFPITSQFVFSFHYTITIWLVTLLISLVLSIIIEFLKNALKWNSLFGRLTNALIDKLSSSVMIK